MSHNRFDLPAVQNLSLDKRLQTAVCKCTCRLGYFWNVFIFCQDFNAAFEYPGLNKVSNTGPDVFAINCFPAYSLATDP